MEIQDREARFMKEGAFEKVWSYGRGRKTEYSTLPLGAGI